MIAARILGNGLDRRIAAALALLVALAAIVPALNLLLPPTSPFHVPTHIVSLFGKYLCYALLAISI